ncbi:MAG: MFS transporter [Bacteroidetes bacterium]|nr:MFS transporter [Bacteroidota bacterium]
MKRWHQIPFLSQFAINPEFTTYIVARVLFIAGLRMTPVLLGWRLYQITGSKLALGILGLSEVIPAIALALPAGVRVDRSDKRKLLITCMGLYLVLMAGLMLATSDWYTNQYSNQVAAWTIYFLIAGTGAVRAYSGAAFNAFLAQLVPTESLVKAASINSIGWLIAAVIGPAFAGLLMGYTNITVAFIPVLLLPAVAILLFKRITPKPISWQGNTKTWEGVKEGLHFVWNQKALLSAMTLDMFAVLFGGAVALLPAFANDILKVGPQGLGWLVAATYIGNFIALVWFTKRPLKKKQGKALLFVVAGFGLCILVFAMSKSYWLSFFALLASGLFDGVSMIIRSTIVQLFVPDEMRGRVSAVNSMFINSSNELGQFESGVTAAAMGLVPSVIFGGCMTLLVAIVTWIKNPTIRKFEY